MKDIESFLHALKTWVTEQKDISALAVVGSFARARATETSDVDIMLVTTAQQRYLNDDSWITQFGEVEEINRENWGAVQTKRVFYTNGLEAEFNFATSSWANTHPVEDGTRRVVTDGMHILYDRDGILHTLRDAI